MPGNYLGICHRGEANVERVRHRGKLLVRLPGMQPDFLGPNRILTQKAPMRRRRYVLSAWAPFSSRACNVTLPRTLFDSNSIRILAARPQVGFSLRDSSHQRHKPAAAGDFEFAEDRVKMLFHHWHTQPGVFGDLLVAPPVANKRGNFLFAARKLG